LGEASLLRSLTPQGLEGAIQSAEGRAFGFAQSRGRDWMVTGLRERRFACRNGYD